MKTILIFLSLSGGLGMLFLGTELSIITTSIKELGMTGMAVAAAYFIFRQWNKDKTEFSNAIKQERTETAEERKLYLEFITKDLREERRLSSDLIRYINLKEKEKLYPKRKKEEEYDNEHE